MSASSSFGLGLALALGLAAPAASRAQSAAPETATIAPTPDEAALLAADARQRDAVANVDLPAIAAGAHPNLRVNAPNNRILTREDLIRMVGSGEIRNEVFERVPEQVVITGDVGVVMGRERVYPGAASEQVSGAKAFNATVVQRLIDKWIDGKKSSVSKRSGYTWGVLIHGNRILSSAVFNRIGVEKLIRPIKEFPKSVSKLPIEKYCEDAYDKMVKALEEKYPNKFLAVLFKNPSMSRDIFDDATRLP